MTRAQSPGARFRELIAGNGAAQAPGVADALTARLVAEAGFEAVYCSGGAVSRSFGLPDLGYTTLTRLVDRVASIADVCSLPILVDADSGFGNALTIQQTVRALERAGAAGLHIEDENVPARTRDPVRNLIPVTTMVQNLEAAMAARSDSSFVVAARTSVLPHLGLDEAIRRANIYAEAGADLVYIEFIKSRPEIEAIADRVHGPKLISQNKGHTVLMPPADLGKMGYRVVTYPSDTQLAAIHAIRSVLGAIRERGNAADFEAMVSLAGRDIVVDTARHRREVERFLPE